MNQGAEIRLSRPESELEVKLKVPCWFEQVVRWNYPPNRIFQRFLSHQTACSATIGPQYLQKLDPEGHLGLCDSACPPRRCLPHAFTEEAVNHWCTYSRRLRWCLCVCVSFSTQQHARRCRGASAFQLRFGKTRQIKDWPRPLSSPASLVKFTVCSRKSINIVLRNQD